MNLIFIGDSNVILKNGEDLICIPHYISCKPYIDKNFISEDLKKIRITYYDEEYDDFVIICVTSKHIALMDSNGYICINDIFVYRNDISVVTDMGNVSINDFFKYSYSEEYIGVYNNIALVTNGLDIYAIHLGNHTLENYLFQDVTDVIDLSKLKDVEVQTVYDYGDGDIEKITYTHGLFIKHKGISYYIYTLKEHGSIIGHKCAYYKCDFTKNNFDIIEKL